jgi:hypothetical protein
MKPTLLILAAGIGSRYGGIKQLDQFGPNGETIMDYSLYDAIRSGFGKVVFIVRKEIKEEAEALFASKLKGKIAYDFAIQGIQSYVPDGGQDMLLCVLGKKQIRHLPSSMQMIFMVVVHLLPCRNFYKMIPTIISMP